MESTISTGALVFESSDATVSQLAWKALLRRCRYNWLYLLLLNALGQLVDPRLNHLPGWNLIWALNVAFCVVRIWFGRRLAGKETLPLKELRLLGWAIAGHALLASIGVSLLYWEFGFDQIGLMATLLISGYSWGTIITYRSNLHLQRMVMLGYLLCPLFTAVLMGYKHMANTHMGLAVILHLMGTVMFCWHQGGSENGDFWEALHAMRTVKIARQRAEAAAKVQAELMAKRARQSALTAERARIAAEWHDTLLAGLSAIGWQIDSAGSKLSERNAEAARELDLARRMLNHYRAEARFVVADLQSGSDENSFSSALANALKPLIGGRAVDLKFELRGGDPIVPANKRHQLIRICQEAVANALKHADPESISVTVCNEATAVRLEVRDDGTGFEIPEAAPGHFGLTIMRERAARIGATLEIVSEPAKGTTVDVSLPVSRRDKQRADVLILNTNEQTIESLRANVQAREDLRIVGTATDGEDALRLFREYLPDIAIVDLDLPDMSGLEVVKAMRVTDPFANIVVTSNYEDTEQRHLATEAGAAAFVIHQTGGAEMLAAIDSILAGTQYEPESFRLAADVRLPEIEFSQLEQDVLEHIWENRSDAETALGLGVSKKTVRRAMESIRAKLGAVDRQQAVDIAVRLRLVTVKSGRQEVGLGFGGAVASPEAAGD